MGGTPGEMSFTCFSRAISLRTSGPQTVLATVANSPESCASQPMYRAKQNRPVQMHRKPVIINSVLRFLKGTWYTFFSIIGNKQPHCTTAVH